MADGRSLAFGEELLMQLQLNVHRLVVVYRVPALDALDASTLAVRTERWRIGAERAGWESGWRYSPIAGDPGRRLAKIIATLSPATIFSKTSRRSWRPPITRFSARDDGSARL